MMDGLPWTLSQATPIADEIAERLAPFCDRVCVAGSIRRRSAVVHDVELVVIPSRRQRWVPLFDDIDVRPPAPPVDELDEYLNDLEHRADIRKRRDRRGRLFWGPSDKRILWRYGAASDAWIPLDIFGAIEPTFGAKLALRTGPFEFSKRLVTPRAKGGLMPDDLEFRRGGLYRFDTSTNARFRTFVPTPDEETLFRELGLPYVAPEHRFATTYDERWAGRAR